jgi:hypothetical protein
VLSANVLRLGSLVVAATASGYLWRAALEPRGGTKVLRVATPSVAFKVPGAPVNPFARLPLVQGEALEARVVRAKPPRRVVTRTRKARTTVLIARSVPTQTRARTSSAASTRRRRTIWPRPEPRPAKPPRQRRPAPRRPPAPPPPPPVQPPPPPPPPPVTPPPPPPPPPTTPPTGGRGDDLNNNWPPAGRRNRDESRKDEKSRDTRPGWGKGDKNHEHTGPPGHQKDKKHKK